MERIKAREVEQLVIQALRDIESETLHGRGTSSVAYRVQRLDPRPTDSQVAGALRRLEKADVVSNQARIANKARWRLVEAIKAEREAKDAERRAELREKYSVDTDEQLAQVMLDKLVAEAAELIERAAESGDPLTIVDLRSGLNRGTRYVR